MSMCLCLWVCVSPSKHASVTPKHHISLFLFSPNGHFGFSEVCAGHYDITKYDNGTCVCLQSECNASCRAMALRSTTLHLQAFQRFPAASGSPFSTHRRRAERLQNPAVAPVRRAGAWCTMGQVNNNNNNNSPPVLYSPTSALQNACCGCTGAQLHASASSSARHSTSSASVQRMPLTENGIFLNTDAMFFLPLRCCADALQSRSSGGQQRPPSAFFFF